MKKKDWTTTVARACACLAASAAGIACADSTPTYATHGDPMLGALIAEAMVRNPAMQEASALHHQALHAVRQATALPDPLLTFTRHAAPVQTRVGPQVGGVAVSQRLPWVGKRAERGRVAEWEAEARRHDAAAVALDTVRQIKRDYYELGYLDQAAAIADEEADLLRHHEALAQARYTQGIGLQQEVVKLQAEITRAMSKREGFRRQRVDVESRLNELRNAPAHEEVPSVRLGSRPNLRLDYPTLAAIGREHRPEIHAAAARVRGAESSLRLSRQAYRPDVVVGAAWGSVQNRRDIDGRAGPPMDNGDDVLSVSVGITIPIYRAALHAGDEAARARLDAAEHARRATLGRVEQAIRSASSRLVAIDKQIALFERTLLPQAEQALATTEDAYATGATGVAELLDTETAMLDVRLGLARLNADYFQTLADLERAAGRALPAEAETGRAEP